MEEQDFQPTVGERCRLRGKYSGTISFIDFSGGWTRVDWDEDCEDGAPQMCQLSDLELIDVQPDDTIGVPAKRPAVDGGIRERVRRIVARCVGR